MKSEKQPLPPVAQAGLAGILLTFVVAFLAQQFGVALLGAGIQLVLALLVGGLCAAGVNFLVKRTSA